jgi:(p)ppGpp synthase/HD superfamily hydrolase
MRRKSGEPYILHPLAVAQVRWKKWAGYHQHCGGAAAMMVEDTPAKFRTSARVRC